MNSALLALGRWECLTGNQRGSRVGGSTLPSGTTGELAEALAFVDTADDDVTEEASAELRRSEGNGARGSWVRAALGALPRRDREILDLIYRQFFPPATPKPSPSHSSPSQSTSPPNSPSPPT